MDEEWRMRLSGLARYEVPEEHLGTIVVTYDDGVLVHGSSSCEHLARGAVRLGARLHDVVHETRTCEECINQVLSGSSDAVALWIECDRLARAEADGGAALEHDDVTAQALLEAAAETYEHARHELPHTSPAVEAGRERLHEELRKVRARLRDATGRARLEARCATRAATLLHKDPGAALLLGPRHGVDAVEGETLERAVADAWKSAREGGRSAGESRDAMQRAFEEGRGETPQTHQLTGQADLAPEEGEGLLSYVKRSWERDAGVKLAELHAAWERTREELLAAPGRDLVLARDEEVREGWEELRAAPWTYPNVTSGEKRALLVHPAVAAWLQASGQGDRAEQGTTEDGEELDQLLEAAAGLWDPDGDGALKDGASAVDAARKVLSRD